LTPRKLDMFVLLTALDRCDGDWLSKQSEDVRKEFTPLVAMRWMATLADGPQSAYMLWLVNERVNGHMFDLSSKHPDLIFRLLASCGLGVAKNNHQWLPGVSRKHANNAAADLLLEWFPEANDVEISLLLSKYERAEFRKFIDECGVQPNDVQNVVKAFDKLFPEKTKAARAK
jgi:hypothetical protein